jgi:hypothetical protein
MDYWTSAKLLRGCWSRGFIKELGQLQCDRQSNIMSRDFGNVSSTGSKVHGPHGFNRFM